MKEKYLVPVPNNLIANELQDKISAAYKWNEAGIVSYNLPLLASLSVCENIMLPLNYSEHMKRRQAEPIVEGLLRKFGLEQALHYRQKRLNDYEILVVKFLRAIMRCPEHVVFVMPHSMIPTEDYASFTAFADTLDDFEVTVIEQEHFAGDYLETNFTEISHEKWETLVLKTLK